MKNRILRPGSKVWLMHDNKPTAGRIAVVKLRAYTCTKGHEVIYEVWPYPTSYNLCPFLFLNKARKDLFLTKQELIDSL